MPYNYLVDSKSRPKNLALKQATIIIDEAHNLESAAQDASSFDLTMLQLAGCIREAGLLLLSLIFLPLSSYSSGAERGEVGVASKQGTEWNGTERVM